jgi:hypothetical protein
MTQIQEQKLKKYLHFRDYFSENPLNSELQPTLKLHFENFLHHLDLILKTKEMIDENRKVSENYCFIRDETIQFTLFLSRKITSYALLEELIEAQGLFCFSYDQLVNETDQKLLVLCKNLLQFISLHEPDLVDYGIDKTSISSYRDLLDRHQHIIENKLLCDEIERNHSSLFVELLHKTDDIFEQELEGLNKIVATKSS